jgi:hypothetical protein
VFLVAWWAAKLLALYYFLLLSGVVFILSMLKPNFSAFVMVGSIYIHLPVFKVVLWFISSRKVLFYFHSYSQPPYDDGAKELCGALSLLASYSCFGIFVIQLDLFY